jgi:heat shock protein HtpX
MWELIAANKRNSIILLTVMAVVLILLGFIIGSAIEPNGGGVVGILIAGAVWVIMSLVSYASGDQILLSASGAVKVDHDVHPQLFNVVEEMRIAANLPKMPDIYIIPDEAPNAFATGRSPESASIAVTAGLLSKLNRDELQGVVAHETGHILNRDILFVMMAGIMLGTIVLLANIFLRSMWYGGGSRRRYSSREGGGQGALLFLALAILAAILAPIFAQLLYFAISRRREYLADATGARLTRYPEGLASALEKIAYSPTQLETANKVNAPMFIVNPFRQAQQSTFDLFSTHPPTEKRISILRNMSMGAAFADYEKSYAAVNGGRVIPASGLTDSGVQVRSAGAPAAAPEQARPQKRQLGDIMTAVNNFTVLTCDCGLKIKVPPQSKAAQIQCPRCGKWNQVKSS